MEVCIKSYDMLPDREAFVPGYAVMATQIGDCPADFVGITTTESFRDVTLAWEYLFNR